MKVAIAGYGKEGEASFRYWHNKGADVSIFDEREPAVQAPEGVTLYVGDDAFSKLDGFDVVIRTAGVKPSKLQTSSKIWSATNEFFQLCPAPIIGVTGTKGKGTTCSLITEILRAADKTVHLVGNIGVPALDVLPDITRDDIVVFELSSFQLWDLKKSPETAVVLMIEPDHMDVHTSMEEYVAAKAHIADYQNESDLLIYHPTNKYASEIASHSKAHKKQFMTQRGGAYVSGGQIIVGDVAIAQTKDVGLIGEHNLENICAALAAAWRYTQDIEAAQTALRVFKGLPHRLEFVRELGGVKYYNDSFASAPHALAAAIRAYDQPEILICGGYDRRLDLAPLAEAVTQQKNIKKVLLIGQTAEKIASELQSRQFEAYELLGGRSLDEAVQRAHEIAEQGDVVLLSPGCASFDMFKDFEDRGEQFKTLVAELS